MANGGFFGFPDEFFDDNDRSEHIIYGNMPSDFHDLYASTVLDSPVYGFLTDSEKLIVADDFTDAFWTGGYRGSDQEAWFALLGLSIRDFDWEEYKTIYDGIVYG